MEVLLMTRFIFNIILTLFITILFPNNPCKAAPKRDQSSVSKTANKKVRHLREDEKEEEQPLQKRKRTEEISIIPMDVDKKDEQPENLAIIAQATFPSLTLQSPLSELVQENRSFSTSLGTQGTGLDLPSAALPAHTHPLPTQAPASYSTQNARLHPAATPYLSSVPCTTQDPASIQGPPLHQETQSVSPITSRKKMKNLSNAKFIVLTVTVVLAITVTAFENKKIHFSNPAEKLLMPYIPDYQPTITDLSQLIDAETNIPLNAINTIKMQTKPWNRPKKETTPSSSQKITIITLSTPNRASFASMAQTALKQYADRWGYSVATYTEKLALDRPEEWSKIVALQKHLKNSGEWLVWIDDDIVITNPDIPLTSFIQNQDKDTWLILSEDPWAGRGVPINNGIFLIKDTKKAQNFLNKVWQHGNKDPKLKKRGQSLLEQEAMTREINRKISHTKPKGFLNRLSSFFGIQSKEDNLNGIVLYPLRVMQSIIRCTSYGDDIKKTRWQSGDFAAHPCGNPSEVRQNIIESLTSQGPHPTEEPARFWTDNCAYYR